MKTFSAKWMMTILVVSGLVSSCKKIDNYVAPGEAGVYGTITDAVTNKPIETEQPNGFRIRLLELAYANPQPLDFWGKSDGSFQNTKMFAGKYSIQPIEAPFVLPTAVEVDVNGQTKVDFKVEPFLRISDPVITKENGKLMIGYQLSRTVVTEKIAERAIFISKGSTVSNSANIKKVVTDLTGYTDEVILKQSYKDEIELGAGTYYVRVGNNALACNRPKGATCDS